MRSRVAGPRASSHLGENLLHIRLRADAAAAPASAHRLLQLQRGLEHAAAKACARRLWRSTRIRKRQLLLAVLPRRAFWLEGVPPHHHLVQAWQCHAGRRRAVSLCEIAMQAGNRHWACTAASSSQRTADVGGCCPSGAPSGSLWECLPSTTCGLHQQHSIGDKRVRQCASCRGERHAAPLELPPLQWQRHSIVADCSAIRTKKNCIYSPLPANRPKSTATLRHPHLAGRAIRACLSTAAAPAQQSAPRQGQRRQGRPPPPLKAAWTQARLGWPLKICHTPLFTRARWCGMPCLRWEWQQRHGGRGGRHHTSHEPAAQTPAQLVCATSRSCAMPFNVPRYISSLLKLLISGAGTVHPDP